MLKLGFNRALSGVHFSISSCLRLYPGSSALLLYADVLIIIAKSLYVEG